MPLSKFFIDRPIFAAVISILIVLAGAVSFGALPIAQYPEIAPPTIVVSANYPGANASTVGKTVATPLEQEINGVEDMLYMSSQSTADGRLALTISFKLGTDLDKAQVLVQNRVNTALPRLPEEVQRLGVTTTKNSPDILMVVHLFSPDGSRDQLYISNYALQQVRDPVARLDGVGSLRLFGAREYSMRIWLDPARVAAFNLTAGDVLTALRGQNVQIAGGVLNQPPMSRQGAFEIPVQALGRLETPEQFENILIASDAQGRLIHLRDLARVELGATEYSTNSYLDDKAAIAMPIFQRPGSNALATAKSIKAQMAQLKESFPPGVDYTIAYDPTQFISQSIEEVEKTIFEAAILVVIVVFVFLQTWRAAIIPIIAIPVSLVGTFAVLEAFGFSLNTLSLFGLVLAIGIVVDDAIVVVENVERNLEAGMTPRDAARKTMDEVGGALISIALVLSAVFVPTAFIPGISGQFYRQFALTIASATIISLIVSLTLSPALCALLLKPRDEQLAPPKSVLGRFFGAFNRGFEHMSHRYGKIVARLVRMAGLVLVAYAGLLVLTGVLFKTTPAGFIPAQDQGYLLTIVQLPPGSSLARTDAVVQRTITALRSVEGVAHVAAFTGFDGASFTNASNGATIFVPLKPFEERRSSGAILVEAQQKLAAIADASVFVIAPPPVRGIGTAGGFKMMIEDRGARGDEALYNAVVAMMIEANQVPGLTQVFSFYNIATPQLFVDIDRERAQALGVPPDRMFEALEVYLGSAFVNDFNLLGRTYRVTAQADEQYRRDVDALGDLKARNNQGEMVPLSSVATFSNTTGPSRVPRFNLYPAAELQGSILPGTSTGQAIERMEALAQRILPFGISFEWTELAFQEKQVGNTASLVFAFAVVVVFLVLAAQYESLTLPLSVILVVPMTLLAAISGVLLRGQDNNILTQVGLIVLIGLACKNAILIVEFAKQALDKGEDRFHAAAEAARLRLRPILMTSFAFIFGVVPLAIASGAGAEARQALGTAVFFGMLGVTVFGLFLTPVFFVICSSFGRRDKAAPTLEQSSP